MADIQHWMRKTMTRTPTFPPVPDDRRSAVDTSSLSESSTSRRRSGPRKKISSYFSHRSSKYLDDPTADVWPSAASDHDISAPDIIVMIDAIFIQLCNQPFDGLPAQMNSSVLHVIEAYRNLSMEKGQLDEQLEDTTTRLEAAEKTWEKEEAAFRAEIKRLELFIARGKNGMSRLMASRQDSVINRKRNSRPQAGPSTPAIGEASTPMRLKENTKISQQVTSMSPSSKERALSIQLFSAANQHIPVGGPPQGNVSNTLGRVSAFPGGLKESSSLQGQPSLSEGEGGLADTHAAFSTNDEDLSSEVEEPETLPRCDIARDFQAIKRMASAIATNRGLKVKHVLPKLIELFDNAEEQLEISTNVDAAQRTPTGPQMCRPPSWIPGDDASGWKDSGTIPTIMPPLRIIDSFASSRYEAMSDLSESSSDESGGESAVKRPSKIPSPTHDKGLARSRQEQRSSVVTIVAGPSPGRLETELLSSSANSRRTAFRNSSDQFDSSAASSSKSLKRRSHTTSCHSLSVSAAQGGATSSPDAPAADSTTTTATQRSTPPPVTGRTSGQLPLRQKTNQVDNAVGLAGARAARSSETTVSRMDPVKDGARPRANHERSK